MLRIIKLLVLYWLKTCDQLEEYLKRLPFACGTLEVPWLANIRKTRHKLSSVLSALHETNLFILNVQERPNSLEIINRSALIIPTQKYEYNYMDFIELHTFGFQNGWVRHPANEQEQNIIFSDEISLWGKRSKWPSLKGLLNDPVKPKRPSSYFIYF